MKEAGNLEGILLTGLTKDGVDLMESYVDRTGDVQTASFCMLKVQRQITQNCLFLHSFTQTCLEWRGHMRIENEPLLYKFLCQDEQ